MSEIVLKINLTSYLDTFDAVLGNKLIVTITIFLLMYVTKFRCTGYVFLDSRSKSEKSENFSILYKKQNLFDSVFEDPHHSLTETAESCRQFHVYLAASFFFKK